MASTPTKLMTVEEYAHTPAPPDGYWELQNGELVKVTFPKASHYRIQNRLMELLRQRAGDRGFVGIECAFQPAAHELRSGDVAFVSRERWENVRESYLQGAPELVIEVLSESNTAIEMERKERLCLENGCQEFWVVSPEQRWVRVTTPDFSSRTFQHHESVPLERLMPGAEPLPVAAIFEKL